MMPANRRAVWVSSFVMALALFGSAGASLSHANAESIDEYVRAQMSERRIPGMALAVIRQGRIEKIGAYGKASIEFDVPVATSTPFAVASISKSVTAVAILTLVEAGRLRLDDAVSSHLPDLPQAWQSVTVRQLLTHISGLPDVSVNDYTTATIANTPAEALRLLRDRPVDFVPGANYRYNQTNYMLLGMLIEKLTGLPYSQFVTNRLFKPLNLQNAVFGDARAVVMRRATTYTPYRYDGARPEQASGTEALNAEMATMMYPAGGLNISIDDFARWLAALLDGAIISKQSLDTIWAPTKLNDGTIYQRPANPSLWRSYGLGWVSRLDGPHPFVGGTGGIRAAFFVYPNDDLAVIVLTNWQGAQPESLVDGIARKFL
jgi:CubicO group peptidase (beta-lactamase class C family)